MEAVKELSLLSVSSLRRWRPLTISTSSFQTTNDSENNTSEEQNDTSENTDENTDNSEENNNKNF